MRSSQRRIDPHSREYEKEGLNHGSFNQTGEDRAEKDRIEKDRGDVADVSAIAHYASANRGSAATTLLLSPILPLSPSEQDQTYCHRHSRGRDRWRIDRWRERRADWRRPWRGHGLWHLQVQEAQAPLLLVAVVGW